MNEDSGATLVAPLFAADGGRRLDKVLVERFGEKDGLSRTRLKALVESGRVLVDGLVVTSPSAKLPGQGTLSVAIPQPEPAVPIGQEIPLEVVFEDAHLLVLDKPAGLVAHPASGHADGTLVNALIAHCGDSLSGIGGVRRPGIVHRLDKDTSGLMVVAKTDAAHRGLVALFADHGRTLFLERRYLAVVWGVPDRNAGRVERPIGRDPRRRDRMAIVDENHGRQAVTHWELRERFSGASLVQCQLETGRTHQIRVHLTAIGHPLIGDPVYGTGFRTKVAGLSPEAAEVAADFPRQALHAASLGFCHPVTGEALVFASEPPADLTALIAALRSA